MVSISLKEGKVGHGREMHNAEHFAALVRVLDLNLGTHN